MGAYPAQQEFDDEWNEIKIKLGFVNPSIDDDSPIIFDEEVIVISDED